MSELQSDMQKTIIFITHDLDEALKLGDRPFLSIMFFRGAGIMMASERAIDEYGLELELLESSDMAMTAALADTISEEEWIVVTGWTPHWKFARYALKFLEDPDKVYGDVETINVIARQGLEEDAPEVARFLENFFLEPEQLGTVIGAIADGEEPLEAARHSG